MAASPSQQTHWLKLRVDLGMEQHSGMDPRLELELDPRAVSALPALLCDAVVTACTHTADRREGEGWRRAMHFSSVGQRRLCAAVGLLAHSKENVAERPLHELPQKVGDYVFHTIFIPPLRRFDPLSPSSLFFSLTSLSHPSTPPATTPSVLSAFTQAAQWAALPCRGGPRCIRGSESSCDVLTEVASHKGWHTVPSLHFKANSVMHCSKNSFLQFCSCWGAMAVVILALITPISWE